MAYNLVVNEPFTTKLPSGDKVAFTKGQIVDDQAQVAAILASPHAHHVVKVPAPEPVAAAPVAPVQPSKKGA